MFNSLYLFIIAAGSIYLYLNHITGAGKAENNLATGKMKDYKELKGLTDDKGMRLSLDFCLSEKACYEHVCILGPTGSGKTTSLFLPNLLSDTLPADSSIVVSDPKGELYKLTSNYQRSIGRTPILFSPMEPEKSIKYNPLDICKDVTDVRQLGESLLMNGALSMEIATGKRAGGLEWIQMASPLFIASLLYCRVLKSPYNTIHEALKLIIDHDDEELDGIFRSATEEAREQYNIYKSCVGSERTAASIKITLCSNLQLFTDKKIIETTSRSGLKPERIRNEKVCLYISYPERKSNYLSPFTSCFYSQLIERIIDDFKGNERPVFFLWDEFCNVGQISNFTQNVATVRSRKMSFTLCLQNITQLYQLYGKENALSILNNLKTKVVLPSLTDYETLNFISNLCGYTQVETSTESRNGKGVSHSYSKSRKKLMEPDEIRRLDSNRMLIIAHNRQPVTALQNPFYENKEYIRNSQIP